MLILTRRPAESLTIGDDVVITILGVKGNQVRIGIEAPDDIPIHRTEIYNKLVREEGSAISLADNRGRDHGKV